MSEEVWKSMPELIIRPYSRADEDAVVALWQESGLAVPWNDPHADIERKLAEERELFLVGEIGESIVATCMAGYDGHRGWIYYLCVAEEYRRRGYARAVMNAAENKLRARGCPKIDLMVRDTNLAVIDFYGRLGYSRDEVVVLSKKLEKR